MGLVTDHPIQAARLPGMGQPRRKIGKGTLCLWEEALTRREQQLVEEVRVGMTNRQIAQKLHITPRTVKFHLTNIFAKLHISTREALKPSVEVSHPMNGNAQHPSAVAPQLYRQDVPPGFVSKLSSV
jgi:DNA-binding CsgD family transcriptional regulator